MTIVTDPLSTEPRRAERNARLVRARFWPKLRATLNRVPFVADLAAAYYCATDPETPFQAKALLLGALAYFIVPADVLPDFIAGLGFTDDATVLMTAIQAVRAHLKPQHYERARAMLRIEQEKQGTAA